VREKVSLLNARKENDEERILLLFQSMNRGLPLIFHEEPIPSVHVIKMELNFHLDVLVGRVTD
jgi:hypothetical protein